MNVLSIAWGTNSTAALLIDGSVAACVSEERFSRIKNDERYPKQAIEAVLELSGVSPQQLDAVVFGGQRFDAKAILVHKYSGFSVQDRLREQNEFWGPKLLEGKNPDFLELFDDHIDTAQFGSDWDEIMGELRENGTGPSVESGQEFRRKTVCAHLGIDPARISFVEHHRAHAYYAYFASPVRGKRTLILTADAWGDDCNATVSVAEEGRIRRISTSTEFLAARLYRSITLLLGMKPDEHEYKIMGLAGYAKREYFEEPLQFLRDLQVADGLGFEFRQRPSDLYFFFKDRFAGLRFDTIAGAIQTYTEELLGHWAANTVEATGADHVVFGGGVGMNVKAMMEIAKDPAITQLFVCPSPSDESLAIGAAYAHAYDDVESRGDSPDLGLQPLANAYLGPALTAEDVARVTDEFMADPSYSITAGSDPSLIATGLAEGKVLGRCVGRSEFGARALGNRSILADPRNINVIRKINDRVKNRDFWMPFAPTILENRANDYLAAAKTTAAPYMTLGFHTTALGQEELCAAVHQGDLTCRPQVLAETVNPSYHSLVRAFQEETGVGGLLNTSFNLHGEPIVQSAADAARVFRLSGLDALLLDDVLISKLGTT
jgi:carbamoyltransferase